MSTKHTPGPWTSKGTAGHDRHGADDPDCPRKPPPVQYPRKRGKDCRHCGLLMCREQIDGREYWTCGECGGRTAA